MAFVCKQTQSLFQCFDMFICLFLLCICALYFKEGYAHDGSKNCVHQHPKAHDVSKNGFCYLLEPKFKFHFVSYAVSCGCV